MICTRCSLPGDPSPEAGICLSCFDKERDEKFSLMLREIQRKEINEMVTAVCRICGDEYEKRKDNRVLCCEKCAEEARKRQVSNRQKIREQVAMLNANLNSEWVVEYDPIPVDEGGFERGARIVYSNTNFGDYDSIAFVPGTILYNSKTGKSRKVK